MRLMTPVLLLAALSAPMARAEPPTLRFAAPAVETATQDEPATTARIPTGPWTAAGLPTRLAEGDLRQQAWRIEGATATRDLIAALRAQIEAQGWTVDFACETAACGGFDFRYGLPMLTEPDMHVDLADFRFLAASRGQEALMLMVSRAQQAGFVQLTLIGPGAAVAEPAAPAADTPGDSSAPIARQLETRGSVVIEGLVFGSGAATLESGGDAALQALAGWLMAHPAARVVLVGHTDASGALAPNIALSRARAQAVRAALVALGAKADQIGAEGAGYLAPRATNLTPEGRAQNRRVEVMLTPTL